jgi:hypothetical protein
VVVMLGRQTEEFVLVWASGEVRRRSLAFPVTVAGKSDAEPTAAER